MQSPRRWHSWWSYTTVTVVNSTIHDEYRPSGYFAAVDNLAKNPNSGDIFDTIMMPVGDGLSGYSGGRLVSRFQTTSTTPTRGNSSGGAPTADASAKGIKHFIKILCFAVNKIFIKK